MSKKKIELFASEAEVLRQARAEAENHSLSNDELRASFAKFCDEYENLLEEATFLSRTSDKLQAKLNNKFEQAQIEKEGIAAEADLVRSEKEKILVRNRKLQEEKTDSDVSRSKLQFTMLIMIALLVVVIILSVYYLFLKEMLEGAK